MPPLQSTSQGATQSLPIGTQLEEFVIERVLGSGGFGITYLARDSRLGRKVVIKENLPAQFCWRDTHSLTVCPRHTEGEDADNFQYSLESFEREASTLASLDHPGIVRVLRSFEANGTAYFVMPFVEGTAFDEVARSRQAQGQNFTEEEISGLLWRVLDALAYLHDRGIYHRDIKPGNILIAATGEPVLIDFGAARQRLSERSLTVIESAGYTPFEQLQTRGKVGPWSDLYALGGMLYKAITGETPAKAADRVMDDPVVLLAERSELSARYSSRLLKSIDKAMAPNAVNRFQSCEEWKTWVWSADIPVKLPPEASEQSSVEDSLTIVRRTRRMDSNSQSSLPTVSTEVGESKPPPVEKAPAPKPRLEAEERLRPKALAQWLILAAALVLSICGAGEWWYGRGAETKAKDTNQVLAKLNASNDFDTASTGDTRIVDLGSGVNLTLCYCPPGSFIMGSPANEKERSPDEDQVQVTISRGFWLAQTECTQTQWHAVMNNNPSAFQGDNLPVEQVSWHDVQEFMKKLNDNNVLPEGWKWSLPSEAQWEYACRAGTTTPYAGDLELMAWYDTNSKKRSHPVETKNGNAWSLHDMHGNIYEWCADGYAERLHGGIDPMYDSSGDSRMLRGGSWNSSMRFCRASDRISCKPDNRANHLGFRAAAVKSN